MRLDDYPEKDGKRVWLTPGEVDRLIDQAETGEQRIAFTLGGKAGLRREEIVSVTRNDFQYGPTGYVRIWEDYSKNDKHREAPIPDSFEQYVLGVTEGTDPDGDVVDVVGETVYRWVRRAAERLQAETGDRGWSFLDVHDLRRSWGGHLLWDCGVSPMVVMQFGGWSSWETFAEHYMGEMTPRARDRERSKIDYVGGDPEADQAVFEPRTPGAKQAYGHRP